jgi:hypothetical protein
LNGQVRKGFGGGGGECEREKREAGYVEKERKNNNKRLR